VLQLTGAQRDRIRAIESEWAFGPPGPPRFGPPGGRGGPPNQSPKQMVQRAERVLTPDQLVAWKEMVGEPFSPGRPSPGPGGKAR
jgi:hypothetical protein